MHLIVDGTNELVLHDVRYVPSIKKSLLFVGQMDMHGYSALFDKGSWKLIKGLGYVIGTKSGNLYCLHGQALMVKFISLIEAHSHIELCHKSMQMP